MTALYRCLRCSHEWTRKPRLKDAHAAAVCI